MLGVDQLGAVFVFLVGTYGSCFFLTKLTKLQCYLHLPIILPVNLHFKPGRAFNTKIRFFWCSLL